MKWIAFLIISLILLTACTAPTTPEGVCESDGGEWKEFSSGCADSCSYARATSLLFCTQALTDSCDCGEDKCWNGTACEPN